MITFQTESFKKTLPEFAYLLPAHYEELALHKNKVPLQPQWNIYFDREENGNLIFVTARDSELNEIVGYFIGFIANGLHYETCLTCHMDIFYIRKDLRNGRLGVKLFKFVEAELKKLKVDRWYVGSKSHADISSLFKYLGFEQVETTHCKWLGD